MVPMEEGIINKKENFAAEVLLQEQSSGINDFSTFEDSKNICQKIKPGIIDDIAQEDISEAICQSILFDILKQIEMRPPSIYNDFRTDNKIFNENPDEIHQMQVEEIVVQKVPSMWAEIDENVKESIIDLVPSMQENMVQEGEQFLPG